ncbi:hypothetical protein AU255_09750 [Methyloprofundus sedimenti]|uniref:Uncharacterized protein n=1 Tax=Methyloprofundus sedimenti TaxID=1420851 RepID=A0A1V8M969_9GAMM|nr:hypothetical protein AU255_09750 [Methyloprofundus sedimenti]
MQAGVNNVADWSAGYLDAPGRKTAKNIGFRHEGIKTGIDNQHKNFMASYLVMTVIAIILITYSVIVLASRI